MFEPEFLRHLNWQMEQIRRNFTFTTQFRRQLDQIAQTNQQFASQINMVKQLNSSVYIPKIDFPRITVPNITIPHIEVPNINIPTIDTSQFLDAIEAADRIYEIVRPTLKWQTEFSEQLNQIASQYTDVVNILAVDFVALDLARTLLPLNDIFRDLARLGESEKLANAFNSANWSVAPSMNTELKERVVELFQENKSRYISNVIIGYYHRRDSENLLRMVESWREHPLFEPRMHIIDDAVDAHQNKRYTLSVPALLPLVEGILNDYVAIHNLSARCGKIEQVYNAVLGEVDDYTLSARAIALTILYQLEHNTYVFTNFENELKRSNRRRQVSRHTVLHGVSTNYNTSVTSLRVFVLLDAISALHSQISFNHTDTRE